MQLGSRWVNTTYQMKVSTNLEDARRQAVQLYRQTLRSCGLVKKLYSIPLTEAEMRRKVTHEFRSHGHIDNPEVLDTLVLKGYNLLEEAVGNYTFRSTLWGWFSAVPALLDRCAHPKIQEKPEKMETEQERIEREVMENFANPTAKRLHDGSSFE